MTLLLGWSMLGIHPIRNLKKKRISCYIKWKVKKIREFILMRWVVLARRLD